VPCAGQLGLLQKVSLETVPPVPSQIGKCISGFCHAWTFHTPPSFSFLADAQQYSLSIFLGKTTGCVWEVVGELVSFINRRSGKCHFKYSPRCFECKTKAAKYSSGENGTGWNRMLSKNVKCHKLVLGRMKIRCLAYRCMPLKTSGEMPGESLTHRH